ncbi:NADH dehydrogenase subunit D [Candidatus Heimdallarchaeota archaeon B3_Heim]|nr:MAG: NADH dehydrogenase subunit D [Candidatus Heimdallarchaeota archaeon B3_Heim]
MSEQMYIHMGPQHPVNHGLWTLKVKTEGEQVVGSEILIGYIFRMIEKMAESRPYDTFQPLADRLCYVSAMSWEGTYIMAIEKLLGMEVSKRAQYMRVIMLEFQRIASHFTWLSAYAGDLGVLTMLVIPYREREYVLDLLEHVTGSRMMYNYFRVGGLKHEFPQGFVNDARKLTYYLDERIKEYSAMLEDSKVFMLRSVEVGVLSKENALNLGATGPVLRASGVQGDIRKIEPYLVYPELDFEVPVRTGGDCLARFQIRMEEIRQSTHIIRQALDNLPPEGEINQKAPRRLPQGEVYFRTEDPRGEAGYYIIGNDDKIPYRVKIKSPAYSNLCLTSHLITGGKVADIPPIIASADLCMGEIDR